MNGPIAQFWLERTPDKREVTGSSPVRPTIRSIAECGLRNADCGMQIEKQSISFHNSIPNPQSTIRNIIGGVAQLGERLPCTQEVIGSIPFTSTIIELISRWLMAHGKRNSMSHEPWANYHELITYELSAMSQELFDL